jgi:hypothetical protein
MAENEKETCPNGRQVAIITGRESCNSRAPKQCNLVKEVAMSLHDSTCPLPALPHVDGVRFRYVPGKPGYAVGDDGSILSCRSLAGGPGRPPGPQFSQSWRPVKPTPTSSGHHTITVTDWVNGNRRRKSYLVHVLVLEAFVGPRPGQRIEGCHNNGDQSDNRLENLRWATRSENTIDSIRHGTHSATILTVGNVQDIRIRHEAGESIRELASCYAVKPACIENVINGRSWQWVK